MAPQSKSQWGGPPPDPAPDAMQADVSQTCSVAKQKKAFVSKSSYRRKYEASIQRLKNGRHPLSRMSHHNARDAETEDPDLVRRLSARWSGQPLSGHLGQGPVDPFSTSAMPLTDAMNMYLQHYRVHIIPSSYALDATRMQTWWWQKAVASPTLLQIFVFLAAGHKATLHTRLGVSSEIINESVKDSIQYRIKAIRSLNDLLQDPVLAVADSTVLIVSALLTIEALNADFDALEAHTHGLKTLIFLIGGLDRLEHTTLSTVYQSVITIAALQNSAPILPILPKFRMEIPHEPKIFYGDDISYPYEIWKPLARLGSRFQTAAWATEIHSSMHYRIDVFRRLVRHFELGNFLPNIVAPNDNDLFVVFQHQLHSIHYASETHNLNEPIRLTLLVYLYLRVSRVGNYPIMRHMVAHLQHSLSDDAGLAYYKETAPDLLFWMLLLGGMASQGHRSHPWFVLQLADMAHALGLREWAGVRALLGEFFYTDWPGETAGEDMWNEVLTSRFRHIAPQVTASVGVR